MSRSDEFQRPRRGERAVYQWEVFHQRVRAGGQGETRPHRLASIPRRRFPREQIVLPRRGMSRKMESPRRRGVGRDGRDGRYVRTIVLRIGRPVPIVGHRRQGREGTGGRSHFGTVAQLGQHLRRCSVAAQPYQTSVVRGHFGQDAGAIQSPSRSHGRSAPIVRTIAPEFHLVVPSRSIPQFGWIRQPGRRNGFLGREQEEDDAADRSGHGGRHWRQG
mmetsp:Transcript_17469/g.50943  ORF Transcript_17469/g.50943 Transcript_17469/m.50943 type:complete len:218 (+) Transcript_17469:787-1440(+)